MAQDWSSDAVVYFCSAVDDLSGAVLYWCLDMELVDMSYIKSIKHPVVAAALIFYAIGFLVGYGMGKI